MALQASGEISLNNLATEFGDSPPNSMSEFYSGGSLVANNAVNVNVPSSGAVSLSNYRGSAGTQTRNVSIRLSYTVPAGGSGFGLTNISSTDAPSSISASPNTVVYQPVFHAGTGFITNASITIQQNEQVAANTGHVILYGGTSESAVTNIVAQWDAIQINFQGGSRNYDIVWSADGKISSLTYTGGNYQTQIISLATDNVSAAITAGYTWFGFRLKNPSSYGKSSEIMLGTFYNNSITQPS